MSSTTEASSRRCLRASSLVIAVIAGTLLLGINIYPRIVFTGWLDVGGHYYHEVRGFGWPRLFWTGVYWSDDSTLREPRSEDLRLLNASVRTSLKSLGFNVAFGITVGLIAVTACETLRRRQVTLQVLLAFVIMLALLLGLARIALQLNRDGMGSFRFAPGCLVTAGGDGAMVQLSTLIHCRCKKMTDEVEASIYYTSYERFEGRFKGGRFPRVGSLFHE